MKTPFIYTKESLIKKLLEIKYLGWIANHRRGNSGGVGNTLEDLLGIKENNLPIPNAAEWELKTQRKGTSSLTTLFHMDPSPQGVSIVANILLPRYGWKHEEAGKKYPETEKSFRSTTSATNRTDRGFTIIVDEKERKIKFSHNGPQEINPQPYWGFDDLMYKAGSKLKNCFYILAKTKKERGKEYYHFSEGYQLTGFDFGKFLNCIKEGIILVDFDARTGHNHGTKFRIRQNNWIKLYRECKRIF